MRPKLMALLVFAVLVSSSKKYPWALGTLPACPNLPELLLESS